MEASCHGFVAQHKDFSNQDVSTSNEIFSSNMRHIL